MVGKRPDPNEGVYCSVGSNPGPLIPGPPRNWLRETGRASDAVGEKPSFRGASPRLSLKAAIRTLPLIYVFDNSELRSPFRKVAVFRNGQLVEKSKVAPSWLKDLMA